MPDTPIKVAKGQQPQPPPNYRPAPFSVLRCGTCTHREQTGRCKQFKTPGDPPWVCDAGAVREFQPNQVKLGRHRVLKMAASLALDPGSRMALDVAALGSPVARPGTPRNLARRVQPAQPKPLVNALPGAPPGVPQATPRHTPPPVPQAQPQPRPPGLLNPVPQTPLTPKMARWLKEAQGSPQGQAQGQPPAPAQPPAQAPQPPPGSFKPSPLGVVLKQWNPTPQNRWLDATHSVFNQPAPPPPTEGAQAAQGQTLQNTQRLQQGYQQSGPGKMASHRFKMARELVLTKLAYYPNPWGMPGQSVPGGPNQWAPAHQPYAYPGPNRGPMPPLVQPRPTHVPEWMSTRCPTRP
jgi:hypothetical protein